jgi:Domain of unknown function (DUF4272)
MTAEQLSTKVFADLRAAGFQPAESLPMPDMDAKTRPPQEIAARLMALDALFTWVAFPEENAAAERVVKYIERNGLRDWLTPQEAAILALDRAEAHEGHVDNIGWKLENMWPLAWALGFALEPTVEAAQIPNEVTRAIFYEFLAGLDATIEKQIARGAARLSAELIALEYRFYCAHNAVRSAQLGGKTVPAGFHPIVHGGAVHERRHSLTWCISPENSWEDTDLST